MKNPQFEKLQKLLSANDLAAAEKLCRKAIGQNRNDVNMIAILGAVLLRTGRLDEAERNLQRAIQLAPTFAKPHEDLAMLHMGRKAFKKAESHFRKATRIQPDLESAWFGLVHALKDQGELEQARKVCGEILAKSPDNLNGMRLMAVIASEEGLVPEAGRLLRRIAEKAPESVRAVSDLARFHADQHQYPQAIDLFRRAVQLDPGDPKIQFSLARYLFITGFSVESLAAYDAGLLLDPDSPHGRSGRLYALRNLGRTGDVIKGCRECISQGINVGESWWSLSSLRTYDFSDADIESMKSLLNASGIDDSESAYLDFALGKAMDDRQRYDDAWKHYESGNNSRRNAVYYDGVKQEAKIDGILECVDAQVIARGAAVQLQQVTPIFIVGMPRSGSTLVEQILASHSSVEATTELPYMQGLGERYLVRESVRMPSLVANIGAGKLAEIGDQYLTAAERHRTDSKAYFTDKQPDNFMYVGLITMSLPGAKIIDVRRNPLDTCVGNFRQWFGAGKEFSYDLEELGEYYIQYNRLMNHWDEVLPGKVLALSYEDLVDDTETQIRRILAHCGLSWEDACLDFHQSDRQVTTASSEQVRQPIYNSAVGFWKNYDSHLDGLKSTLAPVLG